MKMEKVKKIPKSNFAHFVDPPIYYFNIVGIEIQPKQTLGATIQKWLICCNIFVVLLQQLLYLAIGQDENSSETDQSAAVTYINYYTMSLGKMICIVYNRRAFIQAVADLSDIYPSVDNERRYQLQHYRRLFRLVYIFLSNFFKIIIIMYLALPLVHSLYDAWVLDGGSFSYRTPVFAWQPIPLEKSKLLYAIHYVLQSIANFSNGQIVLGCDLALFGCVLQICLHLDILSQRILELKPKLGNEASTNIKKLKALIRYHQEILRLADTLDCIFTPSILFSLASSTFIICFASYQLVDEKNLVVVWQTIFLILYELKHVVITCYFGNKLMDASNRFFDAVYDHTWYEGTIEYKRLVNFMLLRTRKPIALSIFGISEVSLVTLKQVLRTSYQIFTVLKCKRDKQ